MTQSEFIKKCEVGCDILFDCKGKHFTLMSAEDTVEISEQYTDANHRSFGNGQELLESYTVDGTPLKNIWNYVHITDVY